MELTDSLKTLLIETAKSLQAVPGACLWHEPSKNWGRVDNSAPRANCGGGG